jgi:hypothetical protein
MNLESFDESDVDSGIHRGKVVAIDDPLLAGRVRVLVYDYMNKLTAADYDGIPWAVPATAVSAGSGVNKGTFSVPDIGSEVFVFFEGKSRFQPVYFAEAPSAVTGLPTFRTVSYPNRMGFNVASFEFYIDKVTGDLSATTLGGVTITAGGSITLNTPMLKVNGNLNVSTGASGTFMSSDGYAVTVLNGIVVNIV